MAPHTSNWDFLVGILVAYTLGVPWRWRFRFLAKHSLFVGPVGAFLRAVGGTPIDRAAKHDFVSQIARTFERDGRFLLAVTPEGTRKRVEYWKTGFYYIALEAKVPMVPVAFDYATKECRFGEPLMPSGDLKADIEKLRPFYERIRPKRPELFGEIRIRD
ncbi:MAG: 1-acyl-sn-glycerol-3-phosphate acyltransferase [Gemmatimonadetes bacterium]|nr:1-acyl-sn-glycerol-3-phosphate acyltransferase [Gemmatimonadota bacterium]